MKSPIKTTYTRLKPPSPVPSKTLYQYQEGSKSKKPPVEIFPDQLFPNPPVIEAQKPLLRGTTFNYHAKYTIYSITTVHDLVNKGKNLPRFQRRGNVKLRFLLTTNDELVFSAEGNPDKNIAPHKRMTGILFSEQSFCHGAGNIFFNPEDEIAIISNKSGDYKFNFDCLQPVLAILFVMGAKFADKLLINQYEDGGLAGIFVVDTALLRNCILEKFSHSKEHFIERNANLPTQVYDFPYHPPETKKRPHSSDEDTSTGHTKKTRSQSSYTNYNSPPPSPIFFQPTTQPHSPQFGEKAEYYDEDPEHEAAILAGVTSDPKDSSPVDEGLKQGSDSIAATTNQKGCRRSLSFL